MANSPAVIVKQYQRNLHDVVVKGPDPREYGRIFGLDLSLIGTTEYKGAVGSMPDLSIEALLNNVPEGLGLSERDGYQICMKKLRLDIELQRESKTYSGPMRTPILRYGFWVIMDDVAPPANETISFWTNYMENLIDPGWTPTQWQQLDFGVRKRTRLLAAQQGFLPSSGQTFLTKLEQADQGGTTDTVGTLLTSVPAYDNIFPSYDIDWGDPTAFEGKLDVESPDGDLLIPSLELLSTTAGDVGLVEGTGGPIGLSTETSLLEETSVYNRMTWKIDGNPDAAFTYKPPVAQVPGFSMQTETYETAGDFFAQTLTVTEIDETAVSNTITDLQVHPIRFDIELEDEVGFDDVQIRNKAIFVLCWLQGQNNDTKVGCTSTLFYN